MIADDLQQTLERYLSGAMSPDESRSFLARADVDQELRRLLEAERVITGAVARDLAATAPAAIVPGEGLRAALELSRTGAASAAGSWMTLKVAAIGVAIGLAGLVGGSLFVAPMIEGDTAKPAQRTIAPPSVETPAAMPQPGVETDASAMTNPSDSRQDAAATSTGAATRDIARAARPADRSGSATDRNGARAATPSASTPARVGIDARPAESLPEYDNQKVPVEFEVKKNK
ncbi:MAG TPA: hypothetical protein VNA88_01170 [Candidatus Kapabacteria bacterium]|nr:hypothetical protein [Candidatus Kapabacteria bacterium]